MSMLCFLGARVAAAEGHVVVQNYSIGLGIRPTAGRFIWGILWRLGRFFAYKAPPIVRASVDCSLKPKQMHGSVRYPRFGSFLTALVSH